jgi:hypothetical protein
VTVSVGDEFGPAVSISSRSESKVTLPSACKISNGAGKSTLTMNGISSCVGTCDGFTILYVEQCTVDPHKHLISLIRILNCEHDEIIRGARSLAASASRT